MSDPADEPAYEQLGEEGNPFGAKHNPDALIEGNRVGTAEDMESSGTDDSDAGAPGYEGEAPNPPLADWGPRGDAPAPEEEQQL
jgi:hypothetical protein